MTDEIKEVNKEVNTGISTGIGKTVERTCPYCNSKYQVKPGLSNMKNLFKKPTWNEWFILILLIAVMVIAFFYYRDIKVCRESMNHLDAICANYKTIHNDSIAAQVDDLSGHLANVESKINSLPLLPPNDS